jgi:H/ACA ribonucleoprotein complex subunit 2
VKEVVKGIRKGERGCVTFVDPCRSDTTHLYHVHSLLILAADINPIDIISHLPVMAEEAQIPYIFVPSKEELGQASSTKRPTSCVMVCPSQKMKPKKGEEATKEEDYKELYEECCEEVNKLDTALVF